ncbi:MAG: SHOCT domain-containing protein [Tepidanaerobacteraceae bacterium]
MFNKGLIDEVEFNKITELNRETFSPILVKIMPLNR